MARDAEGFTPIQQRMLIVLSDGLPHPREELHACLDDELSPYSAIKAHLSSIRKILRPKGQDIICEIVHRRNMYRQIRLLRHRHDE